VPEQNFEKFKFQKDKIQQDKTNYNAKNYTMDQREQFDISFNQMEQFALSISIPDYSTDPDLTSDAMAVENVVKK
jgi:hypothetical protein